MIYGSQHDEPMGTKHNGHIQRYGTLNFGNAIVSIANPI